MEGDLDKTLNHRIYELQQELYELKDTYNKQMRLLVLDDDYHKCDRCEVFTNDLYEIMEETNHTDIYENIFVCDICNMEHIENISEGIPPQQ